MAQQTAGQDVVETLRARAAAAASLVREVEDWAAVAALAVDLAGSARVAVSPGLLTSQPALALALGDRLLVPADDAPFASVADVAVGIIEGVLAVAESGSVLLAHGAPADRAVAMLSQTCVQAVERGRIVGSLDDAAGWLEEHAGTTALATLVTGPSRTADIERSLTIGVQGPSAVHLVIVG